MMALVQERPGATWSDWMGRLLHYGLVLQAMDAMRILDDLNEPLLKHDPENSKSAGLGSESGNYLL